MRGMFEFPPFFTFPSKLNILNPQIQVVVRNCEISNRPVLSLPIVLTFSYVRSLVVRHYFFLLSPYPPVLSLPVALTRSSSLCQ